MTGLARAALRAVGMVALATLGVWSALCAYLYLAQEALVYPRGGAAFHECEDLKALGGQAQVRDSQAGELRYYLFRGARARATLLFFHGNGGSVCGRADWARALSQPDWDLWMLEYPGYGGDARSPSQEGILAGALAAYDLAAAARPGPVLLVGRSLGTGPATYLASRRKTAALVLQSPFPSINAIAGHDYPGIPVSLLNRHPYPAEDWAPSVRCPVLALLARQDQVIPFELSLRQTRNFSGARVEVFEGVGHNDMAGREPGRFWGAVLGGLRRAL